MATKPPHKSAERMIQSELVDYRFKAFPTDSNLIPIAAVAEQQWNALNGRFSLILDALYAGAAFVLVDADDLRRAGTPGV